MDKVLVSGWDARVGQVSDALRALGAEVVVSDDPHRLRQVVAELPPKSLSAYVQLPVSVDVSGETVVGRVRTFLQNGLLARFDAADVVLPALRGDAKVVLVSGNSTVQGEAMPDDAAARFALLNVLAHAVRADKAPGKIRVRMMDADSRPDDIASLTVRGEATPTGLAQVKERESELSYEDWRTEVMGLATIHV